MRLLALLRRHTGAARVLALWLVAMSVPGVEELIEDAVHVIADGHTAHERGHGGEQPGHCCSGLFHVCACHTNAVATPGSLLRQLLPQHADRTVIGSDQRSALRPGFRAPPFRPPARS